VVTLRERPSTLCISASQGAEIYVDGAFARRGGEQVTLELPSGPHRLAVAEKGHRVLSREIELAPARRRTFSSRSSRRVSAERPWLCS
jgi:hypothetical protein